MIDALKDDRDDERSSLFEDLTGIETSLNSLELIHKRDLIGIQMLGRGAVSDRIKQNVHREVPSTLSYSCSSEMATKKLS